MILIKSEREINLMRQSGRIVGLVFEAVKNELRPGMSTYDVDQIALRVIKENNAIPSFKGVNGFKGNICVSVNDELIHGIPSKKRILQDGDIVSVDVGATYKGYVTDACRTLPVGNISSVAKDLIEVTEQSFWHAVDNFAKPGQHISSISHAIGEYAMSRGYSLTTDYTGHGVGKTLHEDPAIPNVGTPGHGPLLKAGMTLAIEPMLNVGTADLIVQKDGWTTKTKDGKLCSHYENTIVITSDGYEVLTTV